jgi:riboflavin kinase/FMN adenylyltransferase
MQLIRHNDTFRLLKPSAYENCPDSAKGSVVALGNFDGVHPGHQQVIGQAVSMAKKLGVPSSVLSFRPHPISVLLHRPTPLRLTNFRQRVRLIEKLGIDFLFMVKFDNEFSTLSAEDFVAKLLVEHLGIKHVVIGDDFIFGHKREGNVELLKSMSKTHGFTLTQVQSVNYNGDTRYSSSSVRESLREGNISEASAKLGHPYIIEGRVKKGKQLGRTINVPTANIKLNNYLRPKFGVYSCIANIEGEYHKAVCNIGNKPTIGSDEDLLEAHIFNFDQDIYGKRIEVELKEFIRAEEKFEDLTALTTQINADIATAKEMLSCS